MQPWKLLEAVRLRNDGGGGSGKNAIKPKSDELPELKPWAEILGEATRSEITVMMHVVIAWATRAQITTHPAHVQRVHTELYYDAARMLEYGVICQNMKEIMDIAPSESRLSQEQLEAAGKLMEQIGNLLGLTPERLQAWYVEAYIAEVARENSEIASGSRQKRELGTWGTNAPELELRPQEEPEKKPERRRSGASRDADDYMHDKHMKDLRLYD
jgi:hypothetical protein